MTKITPEQQVAALRKFPKVLTLSLMQTLTGSQDPRVSVEEFYKAQDEFEAVLTQILEQKPGGDQSANPSQEQIQDMVDVWRVWNAQTPGLRPSVNELMRRAYIAANPR